MGQDWNKPAKVLEDSPANRNALVARTTTRDGYRYISIPALRELLVATDSPEQVWRNPLAASSVGRTAWIVVGPAARQLGVDLGFDNGPYGGALDYYTSSELNRVLSAVYGTDGTDGTDGDGPPPDPPGHLLLGRVGGAEDGAPMHTVEENVGATYYEYWAMRDGARVCAPTREPMDGPLVVCLSGVGANHSVFVAVAEDGTRAWGDGSSMAWRILEEGCSVLLFDFYDHGLSRSYYPDAGDLRTSPPALLDARLRMTPEVMLDQAEHVIRHVLGTAAADRPHVRCCVGHSTGGAIAGALLAERVDVDAAFLVSPAFWNDRSLANIVSDLAHPLTGELHQTGLLDVAGRVEYDQLIARVFALSPDAGPNQALENSARAFFDSLLGPTGLMRPDLFRHPDAFRDSWDRLQRTWGRAAINALPKLLTGTLPAAPRLEHGVGSLAVHFLRDLQLEGYLEKMVGEGGVCATQTPRVRVVVGAEDAVVPVENGSLSSDPGLGRLRDARCVDVKIVAGYGHESIVEEKSTGATPVSDALAELLAEVGAAD